MRSKSDVENRHLLKYAGYPDMQENSLRITDNFALGPEYAVFCSLKDTRFFLRKSCELP
jgi:hypothetical protein